ncbi:hypothetical protein CCACVL1_17679 [Corchorus capsularis]|uniref:Uncharacterized protein n=1 Tax=Corchorus capsularis TaxID=210143 RepID=A0A1R3HQF0_COCAP|nr:hypothetical protein CCACVL1_17679 [Corchorus capsularis]
MGLLSTALSAASVCTLIRQPISPPPHLPHPSRRRHISLTPLSLTIVSSSSSPFSLTRLSLFFTASWSPAPKVATVGLGLSTFKETWSEEGGKLPYLLLFSNNSMRTPSTERFIVHHSAPGCATRDAKIDFARCTL